jgi:23S rRNA (uracil1939-C5)-methyltransferase
VRARVLGDRAELIEIISPSAERQAAPCRHFGRCGGCQLQHWQEAPYLEWKRECVAEALAKRGLGVEVAPVIKAWGQGRRRAAFHADHRTGAMAFVERGGAKLIPIGECPALTPGLEAAALRLAPIAKLFAPRRGDITLHCLETEAGVDVAIKGAGYAEALGREVLEKAAAEAEAASLARLSVNGEPIVMRAKPLLRMGRALVSPPPGAFVQPTALGEETLAGLAMEAIAGAKRVIDLFAGIGTFALRAAEFAELKASEADAEMLNALKAAADGAGGGLKEVSTLRRDLLRTPLSSLEMKRFDAAIIDPPRSGAKLQIEQIARAPIRKLAYVSCDPASFARDVRVLIDHGFSLSRVTPVDQFRWSPHVEVVGAFER